MGVVLEAGAVLDTGKGEAVVEVTRIARWRRGMTHCRLGEWAVAAC